jgi:arylsulfatase A-like enzyme
MKRRFAVIALMVMMQLAYTSCRESDSRERLRATRSTSASGALQTLASKRPRPNVVIFLIDTLRRDHLSCYGYERQTTPRIDELARQGMLFENAVSQASWTPSSVASLFTSRYPSQIGVRPEIHEAGLRRGGSISKLENEALTMAEVFKAAGYETFAVSTNMYVSEGFGLLQGFESTREHTTEWARWVVPQGIELISNMKNEDNAFFLYLHFMDVHEISAPAPFDTMFFDDDLAKPPENRSRWQFTGGEALDTDEFEKWKRKSVALYDGSLAYVDKHIGDFVDFTKSIGIYEDTVFLVLSDHGEEFWEHALVEKEMIFDPRGSHGVGHGHTMFAELLNVPMIFHGPGVDKARVKRLVRNLDVAPTLMELAGIEDRHFSKEGRSLLGVDDPQDPARELAFSEDIAYGYEAKSLQDGRFKYIKSERYEFFFDKQTDPREEGDLSSRGLKEQAFLEERLEKIVERMGHRDSQPVTLDRETEEELRALGYID